MEVFCISVTFQLQPNHAGNFIFRKHIHSPSSIRMYICVYVRVRVYLFMYMSDIVCSSVEESRWSTLYEYLRVLALIVIIHPT